MDVESSKKPKPPEEDANNNGSTEPVKVDAPPENKDSTTEASDDCIGDIEKGKAVVGKLFEASPDRAANETTAKLKKSSNCKCMKRKGKFYCYRLQQGAWVQVSGIGYPTQEICESNNCFE